MNAEQKRYSVIIDAGAVKMMDTHLEFLSNVSIDAAEKLADQIGKGISSLELMPQRCPMFHTNGTIKNYRKLILGRYQIIFSIEEAISTVRVKYILDSRQNNQF